MRPSIPLSFFLFFLCASLQAQPDTTHQNRGVEVGVNITSTLAGFFNSGGQDLPKDPYLFSLKIIRDANTFRLGANFRLDVSDENSNNGESREIREQEFFARLGMERRLPVTKSFTLFYGADAVGSLFFEKTSFAFFDQLISKEERAGIGGGPFLGVSFSLNDRISFSTETYAYAIFYFGEKYTEIGSPLPPEKQTIHRFTLLPAVPNSLYIHFRF